MLSIVIPTYNREHIIGNAIESILNQESSSWELLIVDDGSTDGTKDVVESFMKDEKRILYIYQDNAGASAARNKGAREAAGKWIAYLDSDDIAYPSFVLTIIDAIEKNKDAVFGVANHDRVLQLLDENGTVLAQKDPFVAHPEGTTLEDFYHWKVKTTSSGLFHKKGLIDAFVWDEQLRFLEDWDLIMSIGQDHPDGFIHIEQPLVRYTQTYGTTEGLCSQATYADWGKAFEYVYQKHKRDLLLEGQTWYPDRVEKYAKLAKEEGEGTVAPAMYKYFPEYFKEVV